MNGALAAVHLNMAHMFPRVLSWVPPRRRRQVRATDPDHPHTLVIARDEACFHAWLGQNVPAADRKRYAYLSTPADLDDFHGTVVVLSGAWRRKDRAELVRAVEPRVACGAARWAA